MPEFCTKTKRFLSILKNENADFNGVTEVQQLQCQKGRRWLKRVNEHRTYVVIMYVS